MPPECADVKRVEQQLGHQSAMTATLKCWLQKIDRPAATHRALLNIALMLGNKQDAQNVCVYIRENVVKSKPSSC